MQTNYGRKQNQANIGMIADNRLTHCDSYCAEGAILFGAPVQRGTNPVEQVKQLTTGGTFFGFAPLTASIISDGYADKDSVSVMRKGALWCPATVALSPSDTIYWDVANKKVTNVSAGNIALTGAVVVDYDAGISGVKVEINLP